MAGPRINYRLGVDGSGLASGFDRASGTLVGIGRRIGTLFGASFALAMVKAAVSHAVRNATRVKDLSDRLGLSTEQFQRFDYAAKLAGRSVEEVGNAIEFLRTAQGKALGGDESAIKAFQDIGISFEQLRSTDAAQLFERIGVAVSSGAIELKDFNELMIVLGRGAKSLFTLLQNGFVDVANSSEASAVVISDNVIGALDNIDDRLLYFKGRWTRMLSEIVVTAVQTTTEWVRDFRKEIMGVISLMVGYYKNTPPPGEEPEGFGGQISFRQRLLNAYLSQQKTVDKMEKEFQAKDDAFEAKIRAGQFAGQRLEPFDFDPAEVKAQKTRELAAFGMPADALARIGGFIGQSVNVRTVERDMLAEQKKTNDQLRRGIRVEGLP